MACVPMIDSPCPLGVEERSRIGSHCEVCDHAVVTLDGMSDTDRKALFAARQGPICVSYTMERKRAVAFGLALAAGLMAGPASAGDVESADRIEGLEVMIMVGGINDPADAEWIDESALPELPVVEEPRSKSTPAIVIKDPEPRR